MLKFFDQSSLHLTEKRAGKRGGLNVGSRATRGHERTCHKAEGKAGISVQVTDALIPLEGTQWRQGVNTSERKCSHKKAPADVQ